MMNLSALDVRRFSSKYVESDGCWEWTAGRSSGYGYFWVSETGNNVPAHRVAWYLQMGAIPEGLEVDHTCRNRGCVNTSHMELVTPRENVLRGVGPSAINARKTECKRGHPFDEANTYWHRGKRSCKECGRRSLRRRRREQALSRS